MISFGYPTGTQLEYTLYFKSACSRRRDRSSSPHTPTSGEHTHYRTFSMFSTLSPYYTTEFLRHSNDGLRRTYFLFSSPTPGLGMIYDTPHAHYLFAVRQCSELHTSDKFVVKQSAQLMLRYHATSVCGGVGRSCTNL